MRERKTHTHTPTHTHTHTQTVMSALPLEGAACEEEFESISAYLQQQRTLPPGVGSKLLCFDALQPMSGVDTAAEKAAKEHGLQVRSLNSQGVDAKIASYCENGNLDNSVFFAKEQKVHRDQVDPELWKKRSAMTPANTYTTGNYLINYLVFDGNHRYAALKIIIGEVSKALKQAPPPTSITIGGHVMKKGFFRQFTSFDAVKLAVIPHSEETLATRCIAYAKRINYVQTIARDNNLIDHIRYIYTYYNAVYSATIKNMGEEMTSLRGNNQKRKRTAANRIMKAVSENLCTQTVSAARAGGVSEKDLKTLALQFDAQKTKAMITLLEYMGDDGLRQIESIQGVDWTGTFELVAESPCLPQTLKWETKAGAVGKVIKRSIPFGGGVNALNAGLARVDHRAAAASKQDKQAYAGILKAAFFAVAAWASFGSVRANYGDQRSMIEQTMNFLIPVEPTQPLPEQLAIFWQDFNFIVRLQQEAHAGDSESARYGSSTVMTEPRYCIMVLLAALPLIRYSSEPFVPAKQIRVVLGSFADAWHAENPGAPATTTEATFEGYTAAVTKTRQAKEQAEREAKEREEQEQEERRRQEIENLSKRERLDNERRKAIAAEQAHREGLVAAFREDQENKTTLQNLATAQAAKAKDEETDDANFALFDATPTATLSKLEKDNATPRAIQEQLGTPRLAVLSLCEFTSSSFWPEFPEMLATYFKRSSRLSWGMFAIHARKQDWPQLSKALLDAQAGENNSKIVIDLPFIISASLGSLSLGGSVGGYGEHTKDNPAWPGHDADDGGLVDSIVIAVFKDAGAHKAWQLDFKNSFYKVGAHRQDEARRQPFGAGMECMQGNTTNAFFLMQPYGVTFNLSASRGFEDAFPRKLGLAKFISNRLAKFLHPEDPSQAVVWCLNGNTDAAYISMTCGLKPFVFGPLTNKPKESSSVHQTSLQGSYMEAYEYLLLRKDISDIFCNHKDVDPLTTFMLPMLIAEATVLAGVPIARFIKTHEPAPRGRPTDKSITTDYWGKFKAGGRAWRDDDRQKLTATFGVQVCNIRNLQGASLDQADVDIDVDNGDDVDSAEYLETATSESESGMFLVPMAKYNSEDGVDDTTEV